MPHHGYFPSTTGYFQVPSVYQCYVDAVFGMIIIKLSIGEIVLITKIKERQKRALEMAMLSFSVATLMFGIPNMVMCVVYIAKSQCNRTVIEIGHRIYTYCILATAFFHLCFITLDKLWASSYPIQHNIQMTRSTIHRVIAVIWLLTALAATALYVTDSNNYMETYIVVQKEKIIPGHTEMALSPYFPKIF